MIITETSRKQVYHAIDSERAYQDKMTASQDRPDMIDDFHMGDTLSAIQHNLNKAMESWYPNSAPYKDTME